MTMNKFRITFQTKNMIIEGKKWSHPRTLDFYETFDECYKWIRYYVSIDESNPENSGIFIKYRIWIQGKDCWEAIYEAKTTYEERT